MMRCKCRFYRFWSILFTIWHMCHILMCNWSESIRERERIDVRIDIIEKMIKANATKEQIISYGFTEAEYAEAENSVYANL